MQCHHLYDKSAWSPGPWQDEPDRAEWRIGAFVALAKRSEHLGFWCGYLGVPPGHPWHGLEWDAEVLATVRVHGGVTFAGPCQTVREPQERLHVICHVPGPGEPDELWWVGLDCAHGDDRVPHLPVEFASARAVERGVYRDLGFVEAELARLAIQAGRAAQGHE